MARTHEPGEAHFQSILPEAIEWEPFPAFPPEARLAALVGEPQKPGPYVAAAPRSITSMKGESHEGTDGYHIPRPIG